MSELKVHKAYNRWIDEEMPTPNDDLICNEVYLKSEADKVIAEKDAEIARLKAIRKVHIEAIESMGAGLQQDEEEILHQKYKRCLAMARWCDEKWGNIATPYGKAVWYRKWQLRWLELAEKFKEAK